MILQSLIEPAYLVAGVLFILGIRDLSSPETARRGNFLASIGMFLAIVGTLMHYDIFQVANDPDRGWLTAYGWIIAGLIFGSAAGAIMAIFMPMTAMPERIAIVNGLGGLASFLVGVSEYYRHVAARTEVALGFDEFHMGVVGFEVMLGGLTFTGSMIAYAKLRGLITGSPVTYKGQNAVNIGWLIVMLGLIAFLVFDIISGGKSLGGVTGFYLLLAMALMFGVMFVLPIGGADMPVVIAMLNAYSGLAAAATGFAISNKVLIIAGALDGSSGLMLSLLMCRAMNRSIGNVLFGAVGQAVKAPEMEGIEGDPKPLSVTEVAGILLGARSVIIVPGYGMAAAGAHFAIRELADLMKDRGASIKYAIHPVAGRMPGHMNVLLADANVPYDELVEMDEINSEFSTTDVALVMGANDICNPAARYAEGSPIYGMPIIDVDNTQMVIVIKRSMSPGFAGIPNELFVGENTYMCFGDGKAIAEQLVETLNI